MGRALFPFDGSGWPRVEFCKAAATHGVMVHGSYVCGLASDRRRILFQGGRSSMARLLSVNVGLPRDIQWKGRTVHTGIWKNPVAGRCKVRRLNLDGDGQGDLAGHGGEHRAVFV